MVRRPRASLPDQQDDHRPERQHLEKSPGLNQRHAAGGHRRPLQGSSGLLADLLRRGGLSGRQIHDRRRTDVQLVALPERRKQVLFPGHEQLLQFPEERDEIRRPYRLRLFLAQQLLRLRQRAVLLQPQRAVPHLRRGKRHLGILQVRRLRSPDLRQHGKRQMRRPRRR